MALKAAFIFLSPSGDSKTADAVVETPDVAVTVAAARDYAEAEEVARRLVEDGVQAIELCGGFGIQGATRIDEAVGENAAVGVVRFDVHPGLGFKSGDAVFAAPGTER